jgi:hypothetical protein
MSLRIRRGSDADRLGVRFDQGEIVWVNSTSTSRPAYKLYVGDGVTLGGRDIVETSAGTNLVYNTNTGRLDVSGLTTDDIAAGTNNQFFTNQLAQNAVAELFANGTMTGIEFVYNDLENKIDVTVTATGTGGSGIESIVEDLTPALGGDLNLNAQDINGTGNVNITGNVIATGTLSATTGLGSNLNLNGFNLTGAGDINVIGAIATTSTITASSGLGADLSLNGFNLEGTGNVDIDGDIIATDVTVIGTLKVESGLSADLGLNEFNIVGSGDINISGTIAASGLASSLDLNGNNIFGAGDVNIEGTLTAANTTFSHTLSSSNPDPLVINAIVSTDIPTYTLNVSAGTFSAPTNLAEGAFIGGFKTAGYYNGVYKFASGIQTQWASDADLTQLYPKSTVYIVTGNNDDGFNFASFDGAGKFTAPTIQPGTYANATARDAALPTPEAGMMVFNIELQQFQGYVSDTGIAAGSASNTTPGWINLN